MSRMQGHASRWLLVGLGVALLLVPVAWGLGVLVRPKGPDPRLRDLGPRLVSNQTSQPLALYGEGFLPGMKAVLGAPLPRELPLTVLDSGHAYARLPPDLLLPPSLMQAEVPVAVKLPDGRLSAPVNLTVVNDAAFQDLTTLAQTEDGRFVFAASATTDTIFAVEPRTRRVTPLKAGDGPSALAIWRDTLVVAHAFSPELRLLRFDGEKAEQRSFKAPAYAAGLAVDAERGIAYVAERARDTVTALSLSEGRPLWNVRVLPNPGPLLLVNGTLWVGSLQTGQLQALDPATGQERAHVQPRPGISILGGRTEAYSAFVMGGKAPRALAYHPRCGVLVSSIGPNIGPNPDRMEISMNGGISVLPVEGAPRFSRHLGFGMGVPEGLAVDEARGLIYAADIALGRIRVLDAARLCGPTEAEVKRAQLQEVPIPPPPAFPTLRPPEDFGFAGHAGLELHSGPRALALSPDARTLYALDRFTGTLAVLDAQDAGQGGVRLREQIPLVDTLAQPARRRGQVLYHADLGRTGLTCDACHLEGHTEGVFFAKTRPLRIYRADTLRGSRETPPYFTPASTRSLAQTARDVGGRNRFHSPPPTPREIEDLALFNSLIAPLPNPFVGEDGAPREMLVLPDGAQGNPRKGLLLFEGAAGCSGCHPAPHFTTDQDPATRGRTFNVGTPQALALRESMQDLMPPTFGPPSLMGTWDVFPLLTSGTAGFVPTEGVLEVGTDFPHRQVLEKAGEVHGKVTRLSREQRDDLLAYLLSL